MDEPQDFATLVRRHQGAVCAVAYAVLRDRGRSEEVAQEAFLVAWQKLPGLAVPPVMPAWICGIARNLAANAARRRKETAMHDHDPADSQTPLDSLLDRERDQLAERALGALPPREREVITLYYRNEQSLAEVASALGISEPAARQGLHRGRERLKTALASVETTLRATRPSPAFTAACVAALAGGLVGRASAATTNATGAKVGLWLGAAAIAVGIATAFVVATATGSASAGADETSALTATTAGANETSDRAVTQTSVRLDPIQRSIMVASIRDTLATDASPAGATAPPPWAAAAPESQHKTFDFNGIVIDRDDKPPTDPPPSGPLKWKSHFNYAFRAAAPLVYECVTSVGHMTGDRKLAFSVHFVGDPTDGTIVDAVTLPAPGLVIDGEATECVRETLMSIELPAPEEPTEYDVYFSYTIRPL